MLSKLILLLGTLIAAAIGYFCLQNKKPLLHSHETAVSAAATETLQPTQLKEEQASAAETAQPQESQPTASETEAEAETTVEQEPETASQEPKSSAEESTAVTLAAPSLNYTSSPSPKLQLHASSTDKSETLMQSIDRICPPKRCKRELTFDDQTAQSKWKKEIVTILELFKENAVSDAKIDIEGDAITVTGSFKDPKALEAVRNSLHELELTGFHVVDQTYLLETKTKAKEERSKKERVEKPAPVKQIVVEPEPQPIVQQVQEAPQQKLSDIQQTSIESTQSQINAMLLENPIYFQKNSNKLTLTSKQVLDRIIDIVNRTTEEIESMRIAGHTDASGSAAYNKRLSEKRAQSVRDYLIEHHIHVPRIETVGYGEEQPITDNPYDKENRRVEITIQRKGE